MGHLNIFCIIVGIIIFKVKEYKLDMYKNRKDLFIVYKLDIIKHSTFFSLPIFLEINLSNELQFLSNAC